MFSRRSASPAFASWFDVMLFRHVSVWLLALSACGNLTPARDDDGSSGSKGPDAGAPIPQREGGTPSCPDTMHDARNCGWCGHDCRTGTCSDGICSGETIAHTTTVEAIAVDDASVFFTDTSMEAVRSCPREPSTVDACKTLMDPIGAGKKLKPRGLSLTSDRFVTGDVLGGVIVLCNKAGCDQDITVVDRAKTAGLYPFAIAADELYWGEPSALAATQVYHDNTPADDRTPDVYGLTRVVVTSSGSRHHLFWVEPSGVGTGSVPYPATAKPFTGFAPRLLLSEPTNDIAVTNDAVWAATSNGLLRIPRAGGDATHVGDGDFRTVVADDAGVYAMRVRGATSTLYTLRPDGSLVAMATGSALGPVALDPLWLHYATAPGPAQEIRRISR
jgi:hypothetical protein